VVQAISERRQDSAAQAERAKAYRRYAEDLRATSQTLHSRRAREILLSTADDYDRLANAIGKMADQPHADCASSITH
jgi:hypothetical protein